MGLAPTRITFSKVREGAESQGGRFEFFKQALALGLAAIAGLAALFSDPSKIPTSLTQKFILIAFSVLAFATIIMSFAGLHVYGNLLRAYYRGELEGQPTTEQGGETPQDAAQYEAWIPRFAAWTSWLIIAAGFLLILFAGWALFAPTAPRAVLALDVARRFVTTEVRNSQSIELTRLEMRGEDFLISYTVVPSRTVYTMQVDKTDSEINYFMRTSSPFNGPSGPDHQVADAQQQFMELGRAAQDLDAKVKGDAALVSGINARLVLMFSRFSCYDAALRNWFARRQIAGWSDTTLSPQDWAVVQAKLVALGLLPASSRHASGRPRSVDGIPGPQTRYAILRLHQRNGVTPALASLSPQDVRDFLGIEVTEGDAGISPTLRDCERIGNGGSALSHP